MAKNKKSFVMYADLIHVVEKLDDELAGKLLKHLLRYVNDENPEPENKIIDLVFEPIKVQLKRDLKKYESIVKKRSEAGKASAEKRKQESINTTHVDISKQESTNPTDNDSVNDNDSVTTNGSSIETSASYDYLSKDKSKDKSKLINCLFDQFDEEARTGQHAIAVEQMLMRLRLNKEALHKLVYIFKGQLLVDNKLHKNTLEFRKHFNNWLNAMDKKGNLEPYRGNKPKGAL